MYAYVCFISVCVCVCVSIIIPCVYYNTNIINVCIIIMNVGIYDLINILYLLFVCVFVCVRACVCVCVVCVCVCVWCVCA